MRLRSSKLVGTPVKEGSVSAAACSSTLETETAKFQTTLGSEQVWTDTRQKGLLSFIIPISIILVLFRNDGFDLSSLGEWKSAAAITALYFALWASKEVCLNFFKYWLMVHRFGISEAHYQLIIGPRGNWQGSEIPTLVSTYDPYRIKVMDAISRRTGHTVINIFRITFYAMVPSNNLRLLTAMLQLPIISTLKLLTESGKNFKDLGRFVFQGSRVMDGRYGRFNLVVVNFWAYAGRIIMFQLMVIYGIEEKLGFALFTLAMMPLLWGDTFGEVVGSFWGTHSFPVYGLGDVNRKTVEGTVAVFLSSLASMILAYYFVLDLPNKDTLFAFHPCTVFLYTSFVAAFVETAAPRSTDNFFLEVSTLLLLMKSLA